MKSLALPATAICCTLFGMTSVPFFDMVEAKESTAKGDRQVRALIEKWDDAYRGLNAATLASLESPDFNLVDRFGESRSPAGVAERQRLWAAGFEAIDTEAFAPTFEIRKIQFAGRSVARVLLCARYANGIVLLDGSRIPPLWESESFLVVEANGAWWVAALDIHDQTAPEGCAADPV
jgi:ketosteroid isomerase-like protein